MQTLPATYEREKPWETRVQYSKNNPQVRNSTTLGKTHAFNTGFLLAAVNTPESTRSTAGRVEMPQKIHAALIIPGGSRDY